MLANAATTYFSARTRRSWRTLGYGAIAAPILFKLHASAPVLALAGTAFVLPAIWNLIASHRERNGDKMPTTVTYLDGHHDRREVHALTLKELVEEWRAELTIEGFVTEAAKLSGEYGRRLCVFYVRIPDLPRAMSESVANLLRAQIRRTDEVASLSSDEFVVCAPLLRDALDADIISRRFAEAFRGGEFGSACKDVHLGKAIYPMDGYTGADLIRHSRLVAQAAA